MVDTLQYVVHQMLPGFTSPRMQIFPLLLLFATPLPTGVLTFRGFEKSVQLDLTARELINLSWLSRFLERGQYD